MPNRPPSPVTRTAAAATEWRCPRCRKLLGLVRAGHLHIRYARAHEYIAALPATCTCRAAAP